MKFSMKPSLVTVQVTFFVVMLTSSGNRFLRALRRNSEDDILETGEHVVNSSLPSHEDVISISNNLFIEYDLLTPQ